MHTAEDFNSEEWEILREENEQEEEVLFDQVGEIMGTLIKTFKASFLPLFDELSSYITPMSNRRMYELVSLSTILKLKRLSATAEPYKDSWKAELKEFSSNNGYDLNKNRDSAPLLLDVLEGFLKYEVWYQPSYNVSLGRDLTVVRREDGFGGDGAVL
ncbi:uncharacterized protein LOC114288289 isoform X2 [Camellia sinensis]|uniref:uncharacterized protein LOC114288289 isoform X2 n=1 Tax=Camellia sinensis TaxID=4442 RepID=UPI001036B80C|nr:uncharacterized protein LOC114288289 isoform X2 [Camellia sinensis]